MISAISFYRFLCVVILQAIYCIDIVTKPMMGGLHTTPVNLNFYITSMNINELYLYRTNLYRTKEIYIEQKFIIVYYFGTCTFT